MGSEDLLETIEMALSGERHLSLKLKVAQRVE